MPTGIPDRKLCCKQPGCEGSKFTTISELKKHQWSHHPQIFEAVGRPLKNKRKSMSGLIRGTPEYRAVDAYNKRMRNRMKKAERLSETKAVTVLPRTPVNGTPVNGTSQLPPEMRVSDLLAALKKDQKFIADVIGYISGIAARHPEAQ